MLNNDNNIIIIVIISMFKEIYEWNRNNLTDYFEVYLKVPVEELRRRDTKGIYFRFNSGEIKNVAGLDLKIDEPKESNILFEYCDNLSVDDMSKKVIKKSLIYNI
jgi:cytidine diphosphoramidate kinase